MRCLGRYSKVSKEVLPVTVTLDGRTVRLDALVDTGNTLADPLSDNFELPPEVYEELTRTSHRHYSPGFYFGKEQAQQTPSHTYVRDWDFIGTVDGWDKGVAHCTQRGKFNLGDTIEVLQPDGSVVTLTPEWIENAEGERVDATPHPMMQYTIPCATPLMPYSLLRMRKPE